MKEEIEFLDFIYQNAKMGQESIGRLLKTRNKNDEIEVVAREQLNDYRRISNSAKGMIERRKKKAKELDIISKVATNMSIKFNLAKDDSQKEVADMLIKGSTMGITQIKKHLDDYKLKNKNVINLANRLLSIEEKNLENLVKFT
ncbi:MAG: hypothetical protein PHP54_04440 [Clostridia bacterium]|nr:hypothetical protein [Clostridia bacterium]